ncbi:MAG TPA: MG2 domain-containing protein, partial [Holophagaceae bacterium]|nr:MG2 domain-containing protein [Holophagaceae bacterium]
MRLRPMFLPRLSSRLLRAAAPLVVGLGLLVPQLASTVRNQEAPWIESGWPRSFAMPRPSLPGEAGVLECSGLVPSDLRVRLHRVKDPATFLNDLLTREDARVAWEPGKAGHDPFDVLREAFLWGGRRTFTTVHRTATRALRDAARETERTQQPMNDPQAPRSGQALPLEERPELAFVQELIPEAPEDEPNAIRLPAQQPGLYLLEVMIRDEAAYVPWLVTDLALLAEQDGSRLRATVVSARDGAPVQDARLTLVSDGKASPLAADAQGESTVPASPGVKRFLWASRGSSLAILAIEGLASATPRQRVYAYTERPLYRPGQEVFVKAIVRTVEKGENALPRNFAPPAYRVLDPEDTEVAKGQAELLNAGTATYGARIQLPNGGRLGLYRVIFTGPAAPAQAEFKVEQFVKPAFAVSVTAAQPKVGVGDALSYSIQARYFYGAAVRSAKAEWFLYQVRPSLNWWDDDAGPAPELKESGTLDLDEDGKGTLGGLTAKEEGLWRLVVKVEDGSGQRNGGQAQVCCAKGDLVIFLSPDREIVAPGQSFKVTAKVLDLDGHEVPGVPVTLKACTIRFTQRGKENGTTMKEDPWSWSYQHRPGEVLQQGQGPEATFTLPKAGLHLLVAEAVDRAGRKVEALRPITIAADNTPLPPVPDMKAAADKREYKVGETAKLLVRLPKPNLQLRWAIEGEQLGERGSRRVPGTSAVIEVPITPALQPNAWAVFEILFDGHRQLVEVPLRAPRVEKRLQVTVLPDKERYQPGETMKVAVEVKDNQGRPSSADLSVGVVDEAIYALSPELHPDPFRFFNPVRRHLVMRAGSTDWSFYDLLRKARDVRSLKQTARGEFKEEDDKVRKNFKDTAYWAPFVAAGADGRAVVDLPLPDNLTAWRATATAVTADTKVGVGRASRPASKPLQVSLTLPRTLTRGEEARAIALVRNLSGHPIQGKVRLEVKNGSVKGTPEATFNIPDQGEYRFALPLLPDQVGALVATARVEGGGLKDGEQQRVEVVEPLVPASASGAVRLAGGSQELTIPAPPNARGEATLVLTPVGSLEQLALPSLPYLIQYPYGCVEQTLSSFVPNLLVADLVKKGLAPEIDWKKLTDLDRNIRDGVFRVYAYQQPNGGWGWYAPNDFGLSANPHTTGYAIQSFATMKRLGYTVDEGVYRRGRDSALKLFQELAQRADAGSTQAEQGDPAADAAFLLMSLSRTGEPIAGLLDSSADKVLQGRWKGNHVLAMLTLAAAEAHHPRAQALVAKLEQSAVQRGGLAYWEGAREFWWSYNSGALIPTGYAIRALSLLKPQSPLLAQGEAFLVSEHQGYGWYSTWSTSQMLEVIPYLAQTRKLNWDAP